MAIGYVLINTAPAKEQDVYNGIMDIPEIKEHHLLFGEYDIMVKIESDDFDKVAQVVVNKIRKIDGVVGTKTLAGVKF